MTRGLTLICVGLGAITAWLFALCVFAADWHLAECMLLATVFLLLSPMMARWAEDHEAAEDEPAGAVIDAPAREVA